MSLTKKEHKKELVNLCIIIENSEKMIKIFQKIIIYQYLSLYYLLEKECIKSDITEVSE